MVIGIALLSSCGMFQKTTKDKHSSEVETQQGKRTEINNIDTGSTQTKEVWKLRFPYIFDGTPGNIFPENLPSNIGFDDQSAMINSLTDALNDVQTKNGKLSGTIGFMEAELTRFINESRGKSSRMNQADTLSKKEVAQDSTIKKQPVIPWWLMVIALFGGFILWDAIKWAVRKLIAKK